MKCLRRGICLGLGVIFFLAHAWATTILPTHPYPGAPLLLKDLPPGVQKVRFLGKEFGVFSLNGKRMALLAVPLGIKPGEYTLVYARTRQVVRIFPHRYPTEYLKVPSKMVSYPPAILTRVKREIRLIKEKVAVFTPQAYFSRPFIWPLHTRVTSPFGLRRFFNGEPRSPHGGIDLAAPMGTPVHAANSGRVVLARSLYLPGKTILIDHGLGIYTIYAHLSRFEVREGQWVKRGEVIGLSGSTGRVTGPHLHFGCYVEGVKIDPQTLLNILGEKWTSSSKRP